MKIVLLLALLPLALGISVHSGFMWNRIPIDQEKAEIEIGKIEPGVLAIHANFTTLHGYVFLRGEFSRAILYHQEFTVPFNKTMFGMITHLPKIPEDKRFLIQALLN